MELLSVRQLIKRVTPGARQGSIYREIEPRVAGPCSYKCGSRERKSTFAIVFLFECDLLTGPFGSPSFCNGFSFKCTSRALRRVRCFCQFKSWFIWQARAPRAFHDYYSFLKWLYCAGLCCAVLCNSSSDANFAQKNLTYIPMCNLVFQKYVC